MERVRKGQEETQDFLMQCEVADNSVVVIKSWPVKAGNSLEGKTGMTCRASRQGLVSAKSLISMRRDEVHSKASMSRFQEVTLDTKSPDEARSDDRG